MEVKDEATAYLAQLAHWCDDTHEQCALETDLFKAAADALERIGVPCVFQAVVFRRGAPVPEGPGAR